jgi:hypothetical protein
MNEHVTVSGLTLQGDGDAPQRPRRHFTNERHRPVRQATMGGDPQALHPVTRENVHEWESVVVTRDGPKHLWGSEWKLSRECGTDLAAWFHCAKAPRWHSVERVLLYAWLSGTHGQPLGSTKSLHEPGEKEGHEVHVH